MAMPSSAVTAARHVKLNVKLKIDSTVDKAEVWVVERDKSTPRDLVLQIFNLPPCILSLLFPCTI